jgi:hypothetical protein
MKHNEYYIESLFQPNSDTFAPDGHGADEMYTAYISGGGHGECIRIYGNAGSCTRRATIIVNALNEDLN